MVVGLYRLCGGQPKPLFLGKKVVLPCPRGTTPPSLRWRSFHLWGRDSLFIVFLPTRLLLSCFLLLLAASCCFLLFPAASCCSLSSVAKPATIMILYSLRVKKFWGVLRCRSNPFINLENLGPVAALLKSRGEGL